jgi:hypothetical protein
VGGSRRQRASSDDRLERARTLGADATVVHPSGPLALGQTAADSIAALRDGKVVGRVATVTERGWASLAAKRAARGLDATGAPLGCRRRRA